MCMYVCLSLLHNNYIRVYVPLLYNIALVCLSILYNNCICVYVPIILHLCVCVCLSIIYNIALMCLGVYSCSFISMCLDMKWWFCVNTHEWWSELNSVSSFINSPLYFWDLLFHWTWNSLTELEWLIKRPRILLCLPQLRDYRCMPLRLAFLYHGCWGSDLRFSCLFSKHFTNWAVSQSYNITLLQGRLSTLVVAVQSAAWVTIAICLIS